MTVRFKKVEQDSDKTYFIVPVLAFMKDFEGFHIYYGWLSFAGEITFSKD
jgi:hypothetical protein